MAKHKRVAFFVEEEWLRSLAALAGTFGVSAEEAIRQSLPDTRVIDLFFQCKDYTPDLQWNEAAEVGRAAIREHLRARYMKGLQDHLARLGLDLNSSAQDVEATSKHALAQLKAEAARPLDQQIARAEHDSVYLSCLYDAWKRAVAGEPGYSIGQVDIVAPNMPGAKTWAVLKDDRPV